MTALTVSEHFGPTWQGEGPHCGRRAQFLRLGLCNLHCAWCDTPYTWDWHGLNGPPQDRSALQRLDIEAIAAKVTPEWGDLLVVTGGEPLVQAHALGELLGLLDDRMEVEIETNGTISPTDRLRTGVDYWNVSPKLTSARSGYELNAETLASFPELNTAFKFVCCGPADLDEVDRIVLLAGLSANRVWIMPEGRDDRALVVRSRLLADEVLERGYNLTTRLHVLLWGDERGR